MEETSSLLLGVAMIGCPLVAGLGAIGGAFAVFPRPTPSGASPPSSGARKFVAIMLGVGGALFLLAALGIGACFGIVVFEI